MDITTAYITNKAYGFPRGARRRVKPVALVCIHITGNSSNLGPTAAMGERNYMNRSTNGEDGRAVSAHYVLNRDGSGVKCVDPEYAAWLNGDIRSPKKSLQIVKNVLALMAKGYNANEAYYLGVEDVGYPGTHPVTADQKETLAQLIARASITTGLPVNRTTVGQHSDLNTETRAHCANLSETELASIIKRAQEIKDSLTAPEEPMGLSVRLYATTDTTPLDAFGTAKIKGTGHWIIRVKDRVGVKVNDGLDLGVVQRGRLTTPLDNLGTADERSEVVVFNNDGEAYIALLIDVAFAPLPAPPATTGPTQAQYDALKAQLDAANAKVGTLTNESADLSKKLGLAKGKAQEIVSL